MVSSDFSRTRVLVIFGRLRPSGFHLSVAVALSNVMVLFELLRSLGLNGRPTGPRKDMVSSGYMRLLGRPASIALSKVAGSFGRLRPCVLPG